MAGPSKIITVTSIVALCLAVTTAAAFMRNKQKVAFVILPELFENFDLKKELEKKYTGVRNARKKILDSLQIDISVLAKRISDSKAPDKNDAELFERKKMELNSRMQEFDQGNVMLTKEFDEKIITQLNQYVSDFGKENGFDMIYGSTSNGSIMYGSDKFNVTKEVLEYINQKYKGLR